MDDYKRGRQSAFLESIMLTCILCRSKHSTVEYSGQFDSWFHQSNGGPTSECSAREIRKKMREENMDQNTEVLYKDDSVIRGVGGGAIPEDYVPNDNDINKIRTFGVDDDCA